MSEFLHNLRTGKFKRNDRNNWSQSDQQYKGSYRRGDPDGRKGHSSPAHRQEPLQTVINNAVAEMKAILEKIATSQERIADSYELKARADERRAAAVESIAGLLRERFANDPASASEDLTGSASEPQPDALTVPEGHTKTPADPDHDHEQLRNEIINMREKGMSYEKIAQHLESEGVPTFTGRGKWRGQTISKLCKEIQ